MNNNDSDSLKSEIKGADLNKIIHRELIDFDQELHCSITSSNNNLYLCLTCGKAFSGGSDHSPIVQHFFDEMHPLALRLHDNQLVTLPNYQRIPPIPEVEDILFTAKPHYTKQTLQKMHEKMKTFNSVMPGAFEMNSIVKATARISVIRFISCIDPFRDFLLLNDFKTPKAAAFSEFFKHFFNPFYFKNHVSPDKLLHELPNDEDNPFLFLSKILFLLSDEFTKFEKEKQVKPSVGNKKVKVTNVLEENLRGELKIETYDFGTQEWKSEKKKIWMIPLELDDSPLYRSGREKEKIIASTKLIELLQRYNGKEVIDTPNGIGNVLRQKMHFLKAPNYMIFNTNRIGKNDFNDEKRRMHIILPTAPLSFSEYGANTEYSLRAIISHTGTITNGEYITYINNKDNGQWLKCEANKISDTLIEVAILSECCFLLFEKCI